MCARLFVVAGVGVVVGEQGVIVVLWLMIDYDRVVVEVATALRPAVLGAVDVQIGRAAFAVTVDVPAGGVPATSCRDRRAGVTFRVRRLRAAKFVGPYPWAGLGKE